MPPTDPSCIQTENLLLHSRSLNRDVKVDLFLPPDTGDPEMSLLLINDGQNMKELGLATILEDLYSTDEIKPILCVAIHAGPERKMEYGTAIQADYLGRG